MDEKRSISKENDAVVARFIEKYGDLGYPPILCKACLEHGHDYYLRIISGELVTFDGAKPVDSKQVYLLGPSLLNIVTGDVKWEPCDWSQVLVADIQEVGEGNPREIA